MIKYEVKYLEDSGYRYKIYINSDDIIMLEYQEIMPTSGIDEDWVTRDSIKISTLYATEVINTILDILNKVK